MYIIYIYIDLFQPQPASGWAAGREAPEELDTEAGVPACSELF